ncbi:MAG: DUF11 domain-containing protein, partial [Anaerolineae bacterium]|nr:DUF11 domain-containing protein [Anaerolineae bacterium]
GVTVGAAAISQGTCHAAAGVVACTVGEVAAGATITATVVVTPTRPGDLTNRAVVRCNEGDATFDNTATVTTEVIGARRLYLPLVLRR